MTTDSERFQAWLQHAYEARQQDSETMEMGPLRAVVTRGDDGKGEAWVTLVDTNATKSDTLKSFAKLQSTFAKDKVKVEVEYDADALPKAGHWFEEAGLSIVETNPLMACRPETFKPVTSTEISLTRLTEHAKPAELEAFQHLRWSDGGDSKVTGPSIDKLSDELKSATSVYLLAWLEWEPVGTGVSHLTKTAAEIVGVVTRNDRRRRGIAAVVTSDLVTRHFEQGGDFVFLDAANEPAARLYERLGFVRFGSKVLYK